MLTESSALLKEAKDALSKLVADQAAAVAMEEGKAQAFFYKDTIRTDMEALRAPIDKLEMIVDKEMWPMPSYGDLMFEV